jgi:hypothetical protein
MLVLLHYFLISGQFAFCYSACMCPKNVKRGGRGLQDEQLKRLVEMHGEDWDRVSGCFAHRSDIQCQQRWQKVVNPELIKGPWTKEVSAATM